jgi:cytochrome oxidase Cu insertion factor (SCO1/SenC/PrrC family)
MPEPSRPQATPSSRRKVIATLAVVLPLAVGLLIAVIAHFVGGGETEISKPAPAAAVAAAAPQRQVAPAPAAPGTPAPRVRLTEGATGKPFDSASLGETPYAVVFISARCGAVGDYLGEAAAELRRGGDPDAILAISADPAGDTQKAVSAYLTKHHLSGPPFHFLTGDEDELRGLWNAWGFTGPAPTCPASVPAHFVAGSGENAGLIDLDPQAPASLLTDALTGMTK